jgi:SAM-dependent methyltransferase
MQPEILDYYQRGDERDRLATGPGRLEFLRTWDVLTRTLPASPTSVLDVGGATGVYAGPLAEAGYRVEVVDPVPEHVAESGRRPGVTASVGDARALPAKDSSVDAVLLLGPLYHLQDRADRVTAWREAARVVRPGGVVVAAMISRFASLLDGFRHDHFSDPRFGPLVERALVDGVHDNVHGEPAWFTSAYFYHPDEIPAEVVDAGLAVERLVAVESPLWLVGRRLDEILGSAERTELMLDRLRRIESEPSLLGASSHLLAVARRPARL